MSYRIARSLLTLRAEYDRANPGRDRASDGLLGDARHATRTSDHNPWVKDSRGIGVVRAADLDAGRGLYPSETADTPGDNLLASLLKAAMRDHPALGRGAYIIYEGNLYSHSNGWRRERYRGSNPHQSHVHVSVSLAQSGYDSSASWGVSTGATPPSGTTSTKPTVDASNIYPGANGDQVRLVQQALNKVMGSRLSTDGDYGPNTTAVAKEYQRKLYGDGQGIDGDLGLESLQHLAKDTGLFRAVA